MPLSRMLNSTFAMPNIIDSHDMGLRTVLQSRRPKVNAYSTRNLDETGSLTVRVTPRQKNPQSPFLKSALSGQGFNLFNISNNSTIMQLLNHHTLKLSFIYTQVNSLSAM
ncbi:hypothetical protein TNCV_3728731 [Trichonephila clavipes]|nr:hypothetical protein TNCV_3728731 [Trichonephila clavipes]